MRAQIKTLCLIVAAALPDPGVLSLRGDEPGTAPPAAPAEDPVKEYDRTLADYRKTLHELDTVSSKTAEKQKAGTATAEDFAKIMGLQDRSDILRDRVRYLWGSEGFPGRPHPDDDRVRKPAAVAPPPVDPEGPFARGRVLVAERLGQEGSSAVDEAVTRAPLKGCGAGGDEAGCSICEVIRATR